MIKKQNLKLAIVGLGYVGLPLALEFAKKRKVIGFDLNNDRVNQLSLGIDKNFVITMSKLKKINKITFTSNI